MDRQACVFRVFRSMSTKAVPPCVVALMFLWFSAPAFSQAALGTIQGAVFDQTGGVIAGAKVAVTDVARGATRNLVTDQSGQYVAPALTAGAYSVRAEAPGFSALQRDSVLLEVGNTVRVDLVLSPGAQTQTVTVTEEVPAIDTTSATLGGTVTNQSINSLPLNGRNFLQLLTLRPGVVCDSSSCNSTSTNGRRLGADVLLIEGVTQFDLATSNVLINGNNKGGSSATLPLDAVQEFTTKQNAPAEYGWRDGSVINVGVKSGTNSLHGTAYAFGRDDKATAARAYFSGASSNLAREQFGGSVGGPAIKDKLFWFAAVELIREKSSSTAQITIPSDLPIGDPSKSIVDACNAVGRSSVNPLSALIAGLPPGSCVPQPATDSFENLFPYNPTPNTTVLPSIPTVSNSPQNNGLIKGDWNLNEHHHLNGLLFISRADQISPSNYQTYLSALDIGRTSQYSGSWTWTPNSNWVNDFRFGQATTLGNIVNADVHRLASDPWPKGYGINTGVTNPLFGGMPCIAITSFFGTSSTGGGLGQCGKPGARGPQGQLNFRDSVAYLHGNHALKFGGEIVFVKFDDSSLANVVGRINFDSLQAFLLGQPSANGGNIVSGDPFDRFRERWYAAFIGDTWRVTPRLTLTPGIRWEYIGSPHSIDHNHLGTFDPSAPGGIVQVGPGLPHSTLIHPEKANFSPRIGLAWDIGGNGKTVLRGALSRLSSFPSLTAIAQQTPFGASLYDATGNLVIDRSGLEVNTAYPNPLTFSAGQLKWDTVGPVFPIVSASGPYCSPVDVPAGKALVCGTFATDPNFKNPKSLQWNVDIQRALTSRLTLDVAYVGNHGYDEAHSIDLNAVPFGTGWNTPWTATQITAFNATQTPSKRLAAADAGFTSAQICLGQAAAADAGKCVVNGAAITAARPYNAQFPYYNYIVRTTSGFWSNYNGLQVTLDSRNFHGVSFLSAYTYAHSLDMWSKSSQGSQVPVDPNNWYYQYGNSDQDIRHIFRFSPTWAIPGRKGLAQALEGWSLSGIITLQSGLAWGVTDATKNDWAGNGESANGVVSSPNSGTWQTWNYSGPHSAFNASPSNTMPCYGALTGCTKLSFIAAPSTLSPDLAAIQQSCLTAAQAPYQGNSTQMALAVQALNNNACYIRDGGILTPPAYGTLGNAGRNSFSGRPFNNIDLSVAKNWHIGERYGAQFRFETFNLFNHPTLALPGGDPTSGFTGRFGYTNSTQSTPRRMQFGLKLTF